MMAHENCPNREKLFALATGLIGGREGTGVRAHVAVCQRCGRVVSDFERLDATLDEWGPAVPSGAFDARVRATVAAHQAEHSGFTLFGLRSVPLLALACLFVLVVTASLILWHTRRGAVNGNTVPRNSQTTTSEITPADQELALYQNLPALEDEDYDMLADFDVLSEVPRGEKKLAN